MSLPGAGGLCCNLPTTAPPFHSLLLFALALLLPLPAALLCRPERQKGTVDVPRSSAQLPMPALVTLLTACGGARLAAVDHKVLKDCPEDVQKSLRTGHWREAAVRPAQARHPKTWHLAADRHCCCLRCLLHHDETTPGWKRLELWAASRHMACGSSGVRRLWPRSHLYRFCDPS